MTPSSQPKTKSGISVFAPHVGGLSNSNMLTLDIQRGKIICRQNWMTTVFFLIGFVVFGPLLAYMAYTHPEEVQDIPWFIAIPMVLLLVAGNLGLLAGIFRQPRIVLEKSTGTIHLYAYVGSTPKRTIRTDDIKHFVLDRHMFHSNSRSYTNYSISLVLRSGESVMLCCTTDKTLADQYGEYLSTCTGKPILPAGDIP